MESTESHQHQYSHSVRRLFSLPPSEIFEHPTDLSTVASEIPDGPIEGWLAYAPCFHGDPRVAIGPFVPVVTRPYSDGQPVIVIDAAKYSKTEFLYDTEDRGTGRYERSCWYQSGATLRFVNRGL